MDNPATEPATGPLNTNEAAEVFASMLNPEETKEEVKEEAQAVETTQEPADEAKAEPEMVKIDVDGFEIELPKDKAEKLEAERLRQADYTRKTMAAAEERKAAQAEAFKAQQERQAYAANLQRMQVQLEGALQEQHQNTDWDSLLQNDPAEYLRQQHLAQKRQAALQQTYAEQQKIYSQFEAERQEAFKRHISEQQQELVAKLPEWKDSQKAEADKRAIRDYLLKEGFDEAAVANVTDAKAVVMARKAMLYDQMMSKAQAATKKVSTLPTKVERPGVGESPGLDRRTAAFQRLGKSGKVEDAAAVFASLLS